VNDPHPAVRMASVETLIYLINIDKELAVRWFCKACADDLRIAASPRAALFFNHSFHSHFDQLSPIISKMVRSPLDDVTYEGAREATARWLFHGMLEQEVAECCQGTIPQRKGIADVTSYFMSDEKYREQCWELLLPLLDDPEKEVRDAANIMFRGDSLLSCKIDFTKAYIKSKSFCDHPSQLVDKLKDFPGSLLDLADVIFTLCEIFTSKLQKKSRDHSSSVVGVVSDVSSLLLRLYEQSPGTGNEQITNCCLDIWDELFEKRVGMVRELTNAIEK